MKMTNLDKVIENDYEDFGIAAKMSLENYSEAYRRGWLMSYFITTSALEMAGIRITGDKWEKFLEVIRKYENDAVG
jgi:hypothetical protein